MTQVLQFQYLIVVCFDCRSQTSALACYKRDKLTATTSLSKFHIK